MRNNLFIVLAGFLIGGALLSGDLQAQTKAQKDSLKMTRISHLVDTAYFSFVAQTAIPMAGRSRTLTGGYDLTVSKDTIVAYLPYFGRAYTAPMDPSQGGVQFTSKDFTYTTTPKKNGSWDIAIKFKDAGDVQQMMLNITQDGYASLQVISVNRQAISFNGYITARTGKKG